MGRRGTGVYKHSQVYKGSTNCGKTITIPESITDDMYYCYDTGDFFWKDVLKHKNRKSGALGTPKRRCNGQVQSLIITYKGIKYGAHRIAYYLHHGNCPDVVDHIDGNPLNNRIDNLRPADPTLNLWNQKRRVNNTSGLTGVVWHKATDQWRSRINTKGTTYELGFTDSKFEAACLRKSAELKMFGSFQRV